MSEGHGQVGDRGVRGFLSGGLWGLVLGGVTVSGASLVSETPARNDPPAEPQIAAPAAQADTTQTEAPETGGSTASVAEPTVAPEPLEAPTVAAADPIDPDPAPVTETDPGALPETANVAGEIDAPEAPEDETLAIAAETPVFPNPQSVAPQAPNTDAPAVVDTASAEPLPEAAPAIADDAPVAEAVSVEDVDSPDVVGAEDASLLTLQSPAAPAAPEAGDTAEIAGTDVPNQDPTVAEAPAQTPVVVAIVDEPASALPSGDTGVRVNRLTATTDAPETAAEEATAAADAEVFPEGTPALVRYAADGANPQGRPEVSVVLVDDGSFDGAVAAVSGVAFPVSVMLNPSTPDVDARMAAYRAAGVEVGVLAALPASATPTDVEIFFEAAFSALPETVVVLDAGEAGLQADQDVISQTIAALADDGRGLLTVSRGLNTALRTAEAEGVPTGIIFRNLDSEGQDARVIRRFMDQAAFRARQESGVILLGQIRGETISALIQWGAANRASQVAMVPVSKVLIDE